MRVLPFHESSSSHAAATVPHHTYSPTYDPCHPISLYTQAAAALEVKRSAELEAQGKKKKVEEELAALKRQVAEETSALMLKQQQQEMMKQMQVLYMQHHL